MGMTLVDVETLARLLAGPADQRPTVVDVRWKLGGPPGWEGYLAGHIPGAVFLDLDRDVAGPPGTAGRHPLPEPAALQAALRAVGVRTGHPVVAYDSGDGMAAARLWWTLRWSGHRECSVLDGGLASWAAAGHELEEGAVRPEPGDVQVRPGGMPVLDADGAAELARTGVLLDARAEVRDRGETEPIDPVAGHIPGAVNLPAARLVGEDGRLRPPGELRTALNSVAVHAPGFRAAHPEGWFFSGPAEEFSLPAVGAYCGSGVTAAQTVLALEVAGIPDPALYVGSWSDWVSDPSRPVAVGDEQ